MVRKFIRRGLSIVALLSFLVVVISCEENFADIGSGVINNTRFSSNDTILEVLVSNAPIESIRADGLSLNFSPFSGFQGQYLLGVHNNDAYESVEASIVSQVSVDPNTTISSFSNPDNLPFSTQIDTSFIRIPYQATLLSNDGVPNYSLDSVIGNEPFTLNVYEINTFLNRLNPNDPSKTNVFASDFDYDYVTTEGTELNEKDTPDAGFIPTTKDTLLFIRRKASDGSIFDTDTVSFTANATSLVPLPMAIIPLKDNFAKEVFLDNFGSSNFASQTAFNDFFNGVILEAKQKEGTTQGSLISFNLANLSNVTTNAFIEVYYTNTFYTDNTRTEIDTIVKENRSFQLTGIVNNKFVMPSRIYPDNNEVRIQGLAGSEATVKILNGTELSDLRAQNWLINDASLIFYINQSADTTLAPNRLHLYKNGVDANSRTILSQVRDKVSDPVSFGGFVERENNRKDRYVFRITDHLSNLLSGETSYNPELRLKVFNPTDDPIRDTIFRNFNWNTGAVTLLNQDANANGVRRARLKISYSQKKD
ncbi:DUF4270 family protein [Polaribacter sp. WD7]|nr:DUF4270 family protein [Polaribacter sp. WD7]